MTCCITTAIPYVNAEPHLGHALELVQADVLARHRRLRGHSVHLQTGTDDNALKNVTAAKAAGLPVREFVDRGAARFAALGEPLGLAVDDFIRTSTDQRHRDGVRRLWQAGAVRGDFYLRDYQGRYCAGCEQFYADDELVDGGCPEHRVPPEPVTERNWFFRLSRYRDRILDLLESGRIRIEPAARRREAVAFVRAGQADLSVSRPAARSDGWGIPVPGDPSQVIYVWWDALAGYLTANPARWTGAAERIHVIGKGILRFHAVYWPALLLSAGEPLPDTIFVHDYLTLNGAKIAKSAGNAIRPVELIDRYGVDAVRWWLLREVPALGETDFTETRLITRADQELANGLGNLTHRVLALTHRRHGGRVADAPPLDSAVTLAARIDSALARFDFRAATTTLVDVIADANRFVEHTKPWTLDGEELGRALGTAIRTCRVLATELTPFLPDGSARLREQLGTGPAAPVPVRVFPRLA
ncbi:methionyl-tRNA synthetase [Amycolatopsis sulphurea]|uniref:methionine--tRNA ligase n=1 Tax=Amycolatopsis sulphurea TaxID=76022 RepID=A0A2A9F785_9PSEU|nr:methionine--tRNA ligase [Amycolatopsis sulphurea]PFG47277.1 methionyl-tRNA synthetase [Amycolatopsis sulphurea]